MVYLSLFGRCLYLLSMWVRHTEYWGWQKPWQASWPELTQSNPNPIYKTAVEMWSVWFCRRWLGNSLWRCIDWSYSSIWSLQLIGYERFQAISHECVNIWPLHGKLTRLIVVISFDILMFYLQINSLYLCPVIPSRLDLVRTHPSFVVTRLNPARKF